MNNPQSGEKRKRKKKKRAKKDEGECSGSDSDDDGDGKKARKKAKKAKAEEEKREDVMEGVMDVAAKDKVRSIEGLWFFSHLNLSHGDLLGLTFCISFAPE